MVKRFTCTVVIVKCPLCQLTCTAGITPCDGLYACADVYERLTPKGKKATFKTLLMTQLVSGIWHGLFAGYALFFASSAFLFESSKVIYRYEQGLGKRWDFLRTFPPLLFIKFLYTGFVLNYSAIAFLVSLRHMAGHSSSHAFLHRGVSAALSSLKCSCFPYLVTF